MQANIKHALSIENWKGMNEKKININNTNNYGDPI